MDESRAQLLIGSMARACGLSPSALRFYDECDLLRPSALDPATGYRRYDASQVRTACIIRDLRAAGMGLAAVRELLAAEPSARTQLLRRHEEHLAHEITTARAHLRAAARTLTEETEMHPARMTVDAQDLRASLDQLLPICTADDGLPDNLRAVFVEAAEGSLRLVATDRHRLALRDLPAAVGTEGEFTALLGSAGVRRALDALDGIVGCVELAGSAQYLSVTEPELQLPLIPEDFVDYRRVLQVQPGEHVAVTDRGHLAAAVADVPTEQVTLTLRPQSIDVAQTTLAATYDGPGLTVLLNRSYLLQALSTAAGPEVALESAGPLSPLVIRSADAGMQVHLIMPIRPDDVA